MTKNTSCVPKHSVTCVFNVSILLFLCPVFSICWGRFSLKYYFYCFYIMNTVKKSSDSEDYYSVVRAHNICLTCSPYLNVTDNLRAPSLCEQSIAVDQCFEHFLILTLFYLKNFDSLLKIPKILSVFRE